MKPLTLAIIAAAVFFSGLALVSDPEPPTLIISAEILPLQCPIQGGCTPANDQ